MDLLHPSIPPVLRSSAQLGSSSAAIGMSRVALLTSALDLVNTASPSFSRSPAQLESSLPASDPLYLDPLLASRSFAHCDSTIAVPRLACFAPVPPAPEPALIGSSLSLRSSVWLSLSMLALDSAYLSLLSSPRSTVHMGLAMPVLDFLYLGLPPMSQCPARPDPSSLSWGMIQLDFLLLFLGFLGPSTSPSPKSFVRFSAPFPVSTIS